MPCAAALRIGEREWSLIPAKDAVREASRAELWPLCSPGSRTRARERLGALGDLARSSCKLTPGPQSLGTEHLPGPRGLALPSNYPFPVSSRPPQLAVNRQQKLISPGQRRAGLRIPLPWQLLQVFLKGMTRPRARAAFLSLCESLKVRKVTG